MPNYDVSDRSRAYVRDRVQTLMSSTIFIYEDGGTTLGGDGVISYEARSPLYTGKARIWSSDTGATAMAGEAAITLTQTNVSIPFDSYRPKKDDVVEVFDCPPDPHYEGKIFRVVSVNELGQVGDVHRMTVTSYSDSAVWDA